MQTRTRILTGILAAAALAGAGAAGVTSAQASTGTSGHLTFDLRLTALQFFTNSGPITGFPTSPLVPGDRIVGQDRVLQGAVAVGHDDEACTVGFGLDVICQDILVLTGRGDLQVSWTFRWPATGNRGSASFDGIVEGGTGAFRDAHGDYHAQSLPGGETQVTATINGG